MSNRFLIGAFAALLGLAIAGRAAGEIDFHGCLTMEQTHQVFVPHAGSVVVAEIPVGRVDLVIEMISGADVDLQLIDVAFGTEIVAWPDGVLHGAGYECATYAGLQYCYSGYNGIGGQHGNERIDVHGVSNRRLEVRVYGYTAGTADVTVSWQARGSCDGAFSLFVPLGQTLPLGDVPVCLDDVRIDIASDDDVDLRLVDETDGTLIVGYPGGLLDGASLECVEYAGVEYCYSGYNGVGGQYGYEFIEINGTTTRPLSAHVYGYQAGSADVTYSGTPVSGCPNPADLSGNFRVDFADILIVIGAWGNCPTSDPCPADLDGNGTVGFSDILLVIGAWTP
ncbi:MAG: hypothetical protein GY715_22135 [Planctomycetes bacterium]|nr:hypothetical protein [Planctomycetota bacterium]